MSTIGTGPMRPDGYANRPIQHREPEPEASQPAATKPVADGADQPAASETTGGRADGAQYTPSQQALQQRTDQAVRKYSDAQAALAAQSTSSPEQRTKLGVDAQTAKKELDLAVAQEIGAKLDTAYATQSQNPNYSTDELINAYGNNILGRHADDPKARSGVESAITSFREASKAKDGTIHDEIERIDANPNASSEQKLTSLSQKLASQSQTVRNAALNAPEVQAWADDIATKFHQSTTDAPLTDATARFAASLDGLDPALATMVVEKCMPDLLFIAARSEATSSQGFYALSNIVGALGNSQKAQDLQQQIASAIVTFREEKQSINWEPIYRALFEGANVGLAADMLELFKAHGQETMAGELEAAITNGVQGFLANNEAGPLGRYTKAHDAVAQADQELGTLLARSAPLTEEQSRLFIEAYRNRPDVVRLYKAEAKAAEELTTYMREHQELMLSAAANNPGSASHLGKVMGEALKAGQGELVFDLTNAIRANPAVQKAFDAANPGLSDSLLSDSMVAMASTYIAQHGGNIPSALDALAAKLESRAKNSGTFDAIKQSFKEMKELDPGNLVSADRLSTQFKEMAKAGKAWTTGMAAITVLVCGFNGLSSDQIDRVVGSLSTAMGAGAEFTAKAAQYVSRTGTLSLVSAGTAEAAGKFAARSIPAFSAITATTSFASDMENLAQTQDPAYAAAIVGDVMGFVGALTMTNPVGMAMFGFGMLLSVVGGWFGARNQDRQAENHLTQLQDELLEKSHVPEKVRQAISKADPRTVDALLQLGLSPEQLQNLAGLYTDLFDPFARNGANASIAVYRASSAGLTGNEFYGMLEDSTLANPKEPAACIRTVLATMADSMFYANSREEFVASLRQEAKATNNPQDAAILERAATFIESHREHSSGPGMSYE